MNERLAQIRTNALAAEYIYTKKLDKIKLIAVISNSLTILVPILFSGALLIGKGTSYENTLNNVSIALSVILLAIVVLGLICGVEQAKESFLIGRRLNFYIANEAQKLIDSNAVDLAWFLNYVTEMDARDKENIGGISDGLKKEAYRNALQNLIPGRNDVVCSVCKASPFVYAKGTCQVCGNTPKV